MKRIAAFVMVVVLAASFAGTARAELTPEQSKTAEALIGQFTAKEFAARQQAVEKLIELGPDVVPLIRKTLAETKDAEVKLRCGMVLRGLREKFGPAAVGETTPEGNVNYDASRITLDVKDMPLPEVLETLAAQSGNAPVNADKFKDRTVTMKVKDVAYWQAFDRALEAAGVVYQSRWWRGAVPDLVESKDKTPGLAIYAGPVVVWVDRIQHTTITLKTTRFRTDVSGTVMPETQHMISFHMRSVVEDRLSQSGHRVYFAKALTPDGKNVLPPQPQLPDAVGRLYRASWSSTSPVLSFQDTPEGVQGPLMLEGTVRMEFAVGRREVKVDDVFAGGKKTAGDEELQLADVTAERREGTVKISLTLKAAKDKAAMVGYDMPKGYGFALVDPQGVRHAETAGWSQIGNNLTIDFRNVPDVPGKWSLVFVFPGQIVARDFPFTVRDVPLP